MHAYTYPTPEGEDITTIEIQIPAKDGYNDVVIDDCIPIDSGPSETDAALARLGYCRTGEWETDGTGYTATVKPLTGNEGGDT